MTRKICITAVDGNTGFAIAELLLQHRDFSRKMDSLVGLALDPNSDKAQELKSMGATIVPHTVGRVRDMVKTLKEIGADTICLVPPARKDKLDVCVELVDAAKRAEVANVCLISSAGCDYADPKKQPHLREFIDLEALVMQSKGDASTPTGGSPCVIRCVKIRCTTLEEEKQGAFEKKKKDISHVAAHVLTGKGKHGFDDKHRGQMMVVTGPKLCAGPELAAAASKALGAEMKFENISQAEAKRVLKAQSESDSSELQYLLEYYSLVREGKTNYIATTAFRDVTGTAPTEPDEFFRLYQNELRPSKKAKHNHK